MLQWTWGPDISFRSSFSSFGYILQRQSWSYGNSMLKFLRNFRTVYHNSCICWLLCVTVTKISDTNDLKGNALITFLITMAKYLEDRFIFGSCFEWEYHGGSISQLCRKSCGSYLLQGTDEEAERAWAEVGLIWNLQAPFLQFCIY